MTDYAPFPQVELEKLAVFHDSVAKNHPERSFLRHVHEERALTCRNAIASYAALNQRCLEEETVKRLRFSGQLQAGD